MFSLSLLNEQINQKSFCIQGRLHEPETCAVAQGPVLGIMTWLNALLVTGSKFLKTSSTVFSFCTGLHKLCIIRPWATGISIHRLWCSLLHSGFLGPRDTLLSPSQSCWEPPRPHPTPAMAEPGEQLPEEVLALIFCHLPLRDRAAASRVCRAWAAAAMSSAVWHDTDIR